MPPADSGRSWPGGVDSPVIENLRFFEERKTGALRFRPPSPLGEWGYFFPIALTALCQVFHETVYNVHIQTWSRISGDSPYSCFGKKLREELG